MLEEALLWTLKISFPIKCANYLAKIWRELFRFLTATVMEGLRRENTGTWDLKVRDPVDWKSAERKAEILLDMTLRGHQPKVVKISMITTILGELGGICVVRSLTLREDWDENWNRQGDSRVKWSAQKNKVEGDETSARKDEIKENCNENKKEEQKEAEKRDAQMWKGVKTCVRKKGKKAQTYKCMDVQKPFKTV